jgi:hypothetical protein
MGEPIFYLFGKIFIGDEIRVVGQAVSTAMVSPRTNGVVASPKLR